MIELKIHPFRMGAPKEAALKPLEEAAEVYAAWQAVDGCGGPSDCRDCEIRDCCDKPLCLADELADVIQAACKLADRYGIDLQAAMERCEERNRARGSYGDGK